MLTDFRRNAVRRAERLVGAKAQRYVITHPTGRQASFPPWEEPLAGESKWHVALVLVAHTTRPGRWGIPADCRAMRMCRRGLPTTNHQASAAVATRIATLRIPFLQILGHLLRTDRCSFITNPC